MTKTFKIQIGAALTALCLAGAVTPAAAQDNLPARALNAVSVAIASQGDAALEQIRTELKETLLEQIAPYLPKPDARTDAKSAPADAPQR
jgi:hypothetical protein